MIKTTLGVTGATLLCALMPALALAQTSATDEIAKYRQMLADGNPAELWEMRGEELWKTRAGPNKVSLEQCDLGKGPGIVKGAYVALPRYFKDAGKVMDLEQRLVHCRMTLQGLSRDEATKTPFGSTARQSAIEPLVAYITSESRGMKMAVSLAHPLEKRAYEAGKKMFFYRGGSHDFACATCHSVTGQRIRLQELPNILDKANAQAAYTPARP